MTVTHAATGCCRCCCCCCCIMRCCSSCAPSTRCAPFSLRVVLWSLWRATTSGEDLRRAWLRTVLSWGRGVAPLAELNVVWRASQVGASPVVPRARCLPASTKPGLMGNPGALVHTQPRVVMQASPRCAPLLFPLQQRTTPSSKHSTDAASSIRSGGTAAQMNSGASWDDSHSCCYWLLPLLLLLHHAPLQLL